jgi:hypothetical protein
MMQPPTDNLYKFLSIFGLIVFGFSLYLPIQRLEEHSRETARWSAAWGPLVAQLRDMDDDARKELECAIIRRERGVAANVQSCKESDSSKAQRDKSFRQVQLAISELNSGKHNLIFLEAQFDWYRQLGIVTGAFGLFCCAVGFRFWYIKVQKPLDVAALRVSTGIASPSAPK